MAYVNNNTLMDALLASHVAGHVTDECYNLFRDISEQRINIMVKYNRAKYFNEILDLCVDKCLRVWHSFRFEHDNAFSYFISVIDNTIKLWFATTNVKVVSIEEQEHRFDSD